MAVFKGDEVTLEQYTIAVTILAGLTVSKMNMGINIAVAVLGAAVAALTAVSKV